MSAKVILVFCAQALFIQSALSQCTSRTAVAAAPGIAVPALAAPCGLAAPTLAYEGLASPLGYDGLYGRGLGCGFGPAMDFTPTSGGALPVTSASAAAPIGLSVVSENVYEGILTAAGEVPFVGTTGVEGVLPTAGASAVNHACGNGVNAMVSETTAFAPGYRGAIAPAAAIAPLAGIAPAAAISPAVAIAPGAAIAPALAAPALGYRAEWGCGL